MIKVKIKQEFKSIPKDVEFELPKLAVLIGKNGSGKTHLFEALTQGPAVREIQCAQRANLKINYIRFGEMVPQLGPDSGSEHHATKFWEDVRALQYQFDDESKLYGRTLEDFFEKNRTVVVGEAKRICKQLNKSFHEITEEECKTYFKIESVSSISVIGTQLINIFKGYQKKFIENEFSDFLKQKYPEDEQIQSKKVLDPSDFIQLNGKEPWLLMNGLLKEIKLPYEFSIPNRIDLENSYTLKLIGQNKVEIGPEALSTGEKVLLSVMLAMYNTEHNSELVDWIIIDEPDAALHPDFSKLLMDCLKKITETTNISVLISSHSPSTVALCPEGSVFLMDPKKRCPEPISVNKGIKALTEGLPYLKVGINNVCPVFVEGKDAEIYHKLFELAVGDNEFDYAPIFIEPKYCKGSAGKNIGNETSSNPEQEKIFSKDKGLVAQTVKELKEKAKITNILGIIDWDTKNKEDKPLFILGGGRRYAIENYVYDPIFIGLALIDLKPENYSFEDFGITDVTRFEDAHRLSQNDLQKIIDWVFKQLGDAQKLEMSFEQDEKVSCILQNKFEVKLPKLNFLEANAHKWVEKILEQFKVLNDSLLQLKSKNQSSFMLSFTKNYIKRFPDFLSADIAEMFTNIQGYVQDQIPD